MRRLFFVLGIFLCCSCSQNVKSYDIGVNKEDFRRFKEYASDTYGYFQELLLEISKKENVRFYLIELNESQIFSYLDNQKLDGIFSKKIFSSFEKKKYDFSSPIFSMGYSLIVLKDSNIRSLDDLNGKLVGIVNKEDSLTLLNDREKIMDKRYEKTSNVLENVSISYLDAALVDNVEAKGFLENIFSDLKEVEFFKKEEFRLLSLKNKKKFEEGGVPLLPEENVVLVIDRGMRKLKEEGVLEKLREKWSIPKI